jgi:GDP-L-fucose synthase
MEKSSKIFLAGHSGFVGSALRRILEREGYSNVVCKRSSELDLTNSKVTEEFFEKEKPEYVFLAAARAGGIKGISENPADFIYVNTQIQNNVFYNAWKFGVKKLLFLGSSCVYPVGEEQPFKESSIGKGELESNIEPFAVAKLIGIKLCQGFNRQYGTNFIIAIPPSLYGPNDNFTSDGAHFMPAFIKRFHDAKIEGKENVTLWGSGNPKRELMYVDDAAESCLKLMNEYNSSEPINIGSGLDMSIREIGVTVRDVIGYEGGIEFDTSKPDGAMRKLIDSNRSIEMGIKPKINLKEGLRKTYDWYLENCK